MTAFKYRIFVIPPLKISYNLKYLGSLKKKLHFFAGSFKATAKFIIYVGFSVKMRHSKPQINF